MCPYPIMPGLAIRQWRPKHEVVVTERLSTYFPATIANLVPCTPVHLVRAIPKLSGQRDDFGDDQLSNTPGVAEWGIKYCDAMLGCVLRVDLVCAYAETANDYQVLRFPKDPTCELGL